MPTSSPATEARPLTPAAGCGTLESPWTGWESQLEGADPGGPRIHVLAPGFYGVGRPVRLAEDIVLSGDPKQDGRAWFLPSGTANRLDALFVIDGASRVALAGVRLNGRRDGAVHGLIVRSGSSIQVSECRFEDFGHGPGAAVLIEGEAEERAAREIVIQACHFLNGACGIRLGRHAADLLIDDNRFEEITGSAAVIDPKDEWADYGLIFVRNRARVTGVERTAPFLSIHPGAEGIRIAENTFEVEPGAPAVGAAAIDVQGGGPMSRRRVELLINRVAGIAGPGIRAAHCGPAFVAAGNRIVACGTSDAGAIDVRGSHGVLVEDNEISEPAGPGILVRDCAVSRLNGNDVEGSAPELPRGGSAGILVKGEGTRRIRITDNKVRCVKGDGLRIDACAGLRVVGNEVEDCGGGIRVARAKNLLLVGNDCRDNGAGGIRVDREVTRGLVALNYAILNGGADLEVRGTHVRCRSNKVDKEASSAVPSQE